MQYEIHLVRNPDSLGCIKLQIGRSWPHRGRFALRNCGGFFSSEVSTSAHTGGSRGEFVLTGPRAARKANVAHCHSWDMAAAKKEEEEERRKKKVVT